MSCYPIQRRAASGAFISSATGCPNPLGIPAGPLLNGRYVDAALDKGFDVPVHKTVRSIVRESNDWPNVLGVADLPGDLTIERAQEPLVVIPEYREPLPLRIRSAIHPSSRACGRPTYVSRLRTRSPGSWVMCSFEATAREGMTSEEYVADWVAGMQLLTSAGVTVVETNFSCPNEGAASLLCFDVPKVKTITTAIKEKIGDAKLIIKIAYFDEAALRELVSEVGNIVDGFAAINTIPAPVVNPDGTQALPGAHRVKSGICGHAIKWAGLDMVRRLAALRTELGLSYAIVGSGGVTIPRDFKEYRDAGADVVMSATGAMWNPYLAQEIKKAYPDG